MTPRYVVAGIDFAAPSIAAARWTAAYLLDGADLVLAHALCVPEPPRFLRGMHAPVEPLIEDARRGAQVRMRELSPLLGAGRIWPEIRVGRPDDVLTELAHEFQAELVVIGPHGDRPGLWKLLGSTAERVTWRVPSPVLLARGLPSGSPRTLLVPLDESEVTPLVVRKAGEIAKRTGASAIVMHVVNPLLAGDVGIAAAAQERRQAEEQLRKGADTWLRTQVAGTGLEDAAIEVASVIRASRFLPRSRATMSICSSWDATRQDVAGQ